MWTPERIEIGKQLNLAIERGQIDLVRGLCAKHQWLVCDRKWHGQPWMQTAAIKGRIPIVATMLELGFNINALRLPEKSTALVSAIDFNHFELVRFMLEHGADPNLGRALIAAMNCDDEENRLPLIKLLVKHGADVNRLYDVYGDSDNQFTALDWSRPQPEIAEYLRSNGARTAAELKAEYGG